MPDRTDIVLVKAEEWVRTLNEIRALPETQLCPAAERR